MKHELAFVSEAPNTVVEQFIRLLQLVGIPLFASLVVIGLLLLLTSGKNPRRKRAGYIMSIGFTIGVFTVAYVPLLTYHYGGDAPRTATGDETIHSLVDSSAELGSYIFNGLIYASIPLTFTMFYIGLIIMLTAAKSPQKKRLGLGVMIMSPLVQSVVFLFPKLLSLL